VTSLDAPAADSRIPLHLDAEAWVDGATYVEPGYVIFVGEESNVFGEHQDLFDVTADGERFLITESAGTPPLIQNWIER